MKITKTGVQSAGNLQITGDEALGVVVHTDWIAIPPTLPLNIAVSCTGAYNDPTGYYTLQIRFAENGAVFAHPDMNNVMDGGSGIESRVVNIAYPVQAIRFEFMQTQIAAIAQIPGFSTPPLPVAGEAPAPDPYFSQVKWLVEPAAADGIVFVDLSPGHRAYTALNAPKHRKIAGSTSERVFFNNVDGTSEHSGTVPLITSPAGTPWTYECRFMYIGAASVAARSVIASMEMVGPTAMSFGFLDAANGNEFFYSYNESAGSNSILVHPEIATRGILRNLWNTVAMTYDALGILRCFLNGALVGVRAAGGIEGPDYHTERNIGLGFAITMSGPLRLGSSAITATQISEYVDTVRFTLGTARYTASYVPKFPFPTS